MASPAQLAANLENSQKSCGPKSLLGKGISSSNSTKHGLTGRLVLDPDAHADPARRAEARRAFLAGRPPSEASEPSRVHWPVRTGRVMADAGAGAHEDELDGFAAWLAAHPHATPARAEFRRHARLAFLSAVATAAPPLRTRRSFRRLVWVAAAAAILAVTFLLPQPERWRAQLDGRLSFDGTDYLPGDEARLGAALEQPGTLETGVARARLELGDAFAVELLPNSSLAVPQLPSLDGVEPVAFELARGETYLRTSASYPGNPIVVRTALADVSLHGTTVGVLVDEQGTCVCVAEGTARVTSTRLANGFQDVGARSSLRVYSEAGVDPRTEAFPADDSGAGASHTGDLVQFLRGP